MKCIDKLKKIDIKDINTKTKISTQKLQFIIDCDFNMLDKARAKGFIHILSREYKIDFTEWLEAYDAFCANQNEQLQNNNSEAKDKKDVEVNVAFVDSTTKDKTYMGLLLVSCILVFSFIAYFIYKNVVMGSIKQSEDIQIQLESNESEIQSPIKEENKEETKEESSLDNIDVDSIDTNSEALESKDDSNENQAILKDSTPIDINTTLSVTIDPKAPLWIGIIDLNTYQKKQLSISSSYSLNLDKNLLIRTGHGYFDIDLPNQFSKKYVGGNNKYFIYTNEDGLREIKKEEFLEFNRGDEW